MSVLARSERRGWKGKEREHIVETRDTGGSGGVVLPLQLLSESTYQSVYTLPVLVGGGRQNLSLQVDTGSSDLWIASTSCSSSSCSGASGHLYDPSTSTSTSQTFSLSYLRGAVSGPIVLDSVELGGYNITKQALAAATSVDSEQLDPLYSGILGLALPDDSSIASSVAGSDGNTLSANLLGMASSLSAPSAPFFSLALARPGFDAVPSVLGIGLHPQDLVPDPSNIEYDDLVEYHNTHQFWAVSVRAVTVYVAGEARQVQLGSSVSGASYPTAVLDSGTPVILASATITNAIYSTLGISPTSDGTYYIPCTTPVNMTVTLDSRSEIPLHPLDLSSYEGASGSMCIGMIQPIPTTTTVTLPDIILGVPFLRNTYMVMAYEPPGDGGQFTSADTYESAGQVANPQLGLMSLTNISDALAQFNVSRLSSGSGGTASTSHGKKLSVGIDVLLGCVGFLVLCAVLFLSRWAYYRRKWRRSPDAGVDSKDGHLALPDVRYVLARSSSTTDRYSMAERRSVSDDRRSRSVRDVPSCHTDRSSFAHAATDSGSDGELGYLAPGSRMRLARMRDASSARTSVASWDSFYTSQTQTLPDSRYRYHRAGLDSPPAPPRLALGDGGDTPRDVSPAPSHRRLDSDEMVAAPLLAHTRTASGTGGGAGEFGAATRVAKATRIPGYERMSSFTSNDVEGIVGGEATGRSGGGPALASLLSPPQTGCQSAAPGEP